MAKYLSVLAVAFCASCTIGGGASHSYSNADIGLTLTYPSSWIDLKQVVLGKAPRQTLSEIGISRKDLEKTMAGVTFGIVKPGSVNGTNHNANLMVQAVPVTDAECATVNSPSYAAADARQYSSHFPGSSLVSSNAESVTKLHGYTIRIPLHDRVNLQHRFFYCVNRQIVLISSTSSTVDGEESLRQIISTIHVAGL